MMSKILGIDFGTVRTGFALTDSARIIASPFQTVDTDDVFEFLKKLFEKEQIEIVVVGEAKRLNGQPSSITFAQQKFVVKLSKIFPDKKIVRVDEAFTSMEAARTLYMMGMKKKDRQNKGSLDKVSAALILQSYLDRRK